jgi:glycosyltransferase involved in cell wall biosynthesis
MTPTTWALLTGEYPPQRGGVSDYTRLVARGLVAAGDEVHVWTSACGGPRVEDPGVRLHHLPDHFGPRSLLALEGELSRLRGPYQIAVQYTPHAFGYKAMNVPFCLWLSSRWRRRYWVMFHEVAFPWERSHPWKHQLLGLVTRFMAARLTRGAARVFVSIQQWGPVLSRLCGTLPPCEWLPVPSNLDCCPDPIRVEEVRRRLLAHPGAVLIGHFGTFQPSIAPFLQEVLPHLLANDARRIGLLVGRNSGEFARALVSSHPELAPRLVATGGLPADEVAHHLGACDLLLQPYPDGASTRRGSLMAGLALGMPIVTTVGRHSDSVIREGGAVRGVPVDRVEGLVPAVEALLANPEGRRQLGERARALYDQHCSVETVVRAMRAYQAGTENAGGGCLPRPVSDGGHGH